MAHRVIIDYDRRRVTVYTIDGICVMFQGVKNDSLPRAVFDSRWHGQLMSLLASLTLEDEAIQELSLPRVVYEYEDVFPEELPGLPLYKDVDFTIELYPGTFPISLTPYRMTHVELQELKVQLQELLDRGFIIPSISPWGAPILFAKNRDKTLRLCLDYQ